MKGIAFLGMLVTLMIVLYLTISNLKAKPKIPDLGIISADSVPATLTELPAQVKNKLNEAMERGEAERKEAEEMLGK